MSNINMPMERPYATFYLLAIAMFARSANRKANATFCVGNSNVCLSVTVCEIISFELANVFDLNL